VGLRTRRFALLRNFPQRWCHVFYLFPETPCSACGQPHTLHQPYAAGLDREVDCRYNCPVRKTDVELRRPVAYEVVMELPAGAVLMEPAPPKPPAPRPGSRLSHH
jgi:hypothetical protein